MLRTIILRNYKNYKNCKNIKFKLKNKLLYLNL